MPRDLPPGWLDHFEFIDRVGKLIDPAAWDGSEKFAWSEARRLADALALDDTAAIELFNKEVQAGEDQARALANSTTAIESDALCVSCGQPASRIIGGQPFCRDHGKPLQIPKKVRQRLTRRNETRDSDEGSDEETADAGREIAAAAVDHPDHPEALARSRWNWAHARIKNLVLAGILQPAVFCVGELHWPQTTEFREHYPGPRELSIELPSLPFPATIAFREQDIATVTSTIDRKSHSKRKRAGGSTPGPKSSEAFGKALDHSLTEGSLSTGPLPPTLREIEIMVCRDAGYRVGRPRGWSAEVLKKRFGDRIENARKARLAVDTENSENL